MNRDSAPIEIVDLHAHVLPGVDDGAQDLEEALSALARLSEDGVTRVTATPHFRASLLERATREAATLRGFDAAYDELVSAAAQAELEIEVLRGCEFKLDAPSFDLSDPRLRLAGSRYALVEFASFHLPPFAGNQLAAVREAGWVPLLAHPERYAGVSSALDRVEAWIEAGTLLQLNARSLLGSYGPAAQAASREMLRRGWATCLGSDYHARGAPDFGPVIRLFEAGSAGLGDAETEGCEGGSPEAAARVLRTLLADNPTRILADEVVEPGPVWDVPEIDRKTRRRWFR